MMELAGKNVTVIGLGNSGENAALLLKSQGANVKATDSGSSAALTKTKVQLESKGIAVELGLHTAEFIKGQDLAVVSPGVEKSSGALKFAAKYEVPVISELELGYRFCKGRIIAITGTNGKSTVTTLVGEMLKSSGADTVVCGNIGNSLCGEIRNINERTWVVVEVSSAQLERSPEFKPHIAVILNITDDHMDRYRNFYEYFNEKLKIFARQDKNDFLILNYDAENLRHLKGLAASTVLFYGKEPPAVNTYTLSACIKDGKIASSYNGVMRETLSFGDIKLKGLHNLENVIVSCLVASVAGVEPEAIRTAVRGFTGLDHRFETVDIVDGIEYIDDSKGTTVDSTKRALESCRRPVILIAGGKDKHSDYSLIKSALKGKVEAVILIGEATRAIKKAIGAAVGTHEAKTLQEAVALAHKLAKDGWIVLLSPMCSSFDMFRNYKERGEVFREAVKALKNRQKTIAT